MGILMVGLFCVIVVEGRWGRSSSAKQGNGNKIHSSLIHDRHVSHVACPTGSEWAKSPLPLFREMCHPIMMSLLTPEYPPREARAHHWCHDKKMTRSCKRWQQIRSDTKTLGSKGAFVDVEVSLFNHRNTQNRFLTTYHRDWYSMLFRGMNKMTLLTSQTLCLMPSRSSLILA